MFVRHCYNIIGCKHHLFYAYRETYNGCIRTGVIYDEDSIFAISNKNLTIYRNSIEYDDGDIFISIDEENNIMEVRDHNIYITTKEYYVMSVYLKMQRLGYYSETKYVYYDRPDRFIFIDQDYEYIYENNILTSIKTQQVLLVNKFTGLLL